MLCFGSGKTREEHASGNFGFAVFLYSRDIVRSVLFMVDLYAAFPSRLALVSNDVPQNTKDSSKEGTLKANPACEVQPAVRIFRQYFTTITRDRDRSHHDQLHKLQLRVRIRSISCLALSIVLGVMSTCVGMVVPSSWFDIVLSVTLW